MKERVTRSGIAVDLAERTGLSVHKANNFLLMLTDKIVYELVYCGNSVKVLGICSLYRQDKSSVKKTVSTALLASKYSKECGMSSHEALMAEAEVGNLLLGYLKKGLRVVLTGVVSVEVVDGRVKCESSPTLRGANNYYPCRVSLDKTFKKLKEGILS